MSDRELLAFDPQEIGQYLHELEAELVRANSIGASRAGCILAALAVERFLDRTFGPGLARRLVELRQALRALDTGTVEDLVQPLKLAGRPRDPMHRARRKGYAAAAVTIAMAAGRKKEQAARYVVGEVKKSGGEIDATSLIGWRKEAMERSPDDDVRGGHDAIVSAVRTGTLSVHDLHKRIAEVFPPSSAK